jgi:uncharacterized membrane protein YdjX (TVP38/TMEM64 family)
MLWTMVGWMPGLLLYVYLGTVGKAGFDAARSGHQSAVAEYSASFAAVALAVIVLVLLARLAVRTIGATEERAEHHTQPSRFFQLNRLRDRVLRKYVIGVWLL